MLWKAQNDYESQKSSTEFYTGRHRFCFDLIVTVPCFLALGVKKEIICCFDFTGACSQETLDF